MIVREIISQARSEISEKETNYLHTSHTIEAYHVVLSHFYKHRASCYNNKSRLRQGNFWRRPAIWKSASAGTISLIKILAMIFFLSYSPFTPISSNPPSTNTWMKRRRSEYSSHRIDYPFVGLHVSSNRVSSQLFLLVVYRLGSCETLRVMN